MQFVPELPGKLDFASEMTDIHSRNSDVGLAVSLAPFSVLQASFWRHHKNSTVLNQRRL